VAVGDCLSSAFGAGHFRSNQIASRRHRRLRIVFGLLSEKGTALRPDIGCFLSGSGPHIAELLEQDSTVSVALIEQRLRAQGFDGGMTIVKDYVRTLRKSTAARRSLCPHGAGSPATALTSIGPLRRIGLCRHTA
jgi:hypothetical protein